MDPFIGEIRPVGFNFAPLGWAFCQGQIIAIAQNTALFSLLGTTYGGNGQTTFALPNLQGIVPIGVGQGPGLSDRVLGEVDGEQTVLLNTNNLPAHNHSMSAQTTTASTSNSPVGLFTGKTLKTTYGTPSNGALEPSSVIITGGGQPHNNMQPFLSINYIIALNGVFPSRN